MSRCPPDRSRKPWARALDAGQSGARWRQWALAGMLGLPVLASAAPLLSVSSGAFIAGGCLVGHLQTAVSGPLTHNQSCSDGSGFGPGFTRTGEAFATADFGSLGASTLLTLRTPGTTAPTNSGLARASFEGDYVFSGPGSSVIVSLNLDLDGRLAISGGNFNDASVQITLGAPAGFIRALVSILSDRGPIVQGNSLDADADFSPLFGPGGGSVEIDTNAFTVPVGVPVHIFLGLQASGGMNPIAADGLMTSLSDFDSTLTFNRDGPVFSMPAGFTVNGPGVIDNRWIGAAPPGAVAEPGSLVLAALGLAALVGRFPLRTRRA